LDRFIELQVKQNPEAVKIACGYLDWQRQENAKRQIELLPLPTG